MALAKELSVVIGSYNRLPFLKLALESVRAELREATHEIIVVDGGSSDGTLGWLCRQRDVLTVIQHNRGTWRGKSIARRSWGYFMNLGFKIAQGKYVCMLSDDCLVVPGAIRKGTQAADALLASGRKIGAVAFYWRNWPEQDQYWVGRTFGGKLFVNHGLYLREALEAVGFADEQNYAFYHADGDLCLRMAEAGYECIAAEDSYIEHYSHANLEVRETNLAVQRVDWERYAARWSSLDAKRRPEERDSWIYRSYEDPKRTAQRFTKLREVQMNQARLTITAAVGRIRGAMKRALKRAQTRA